MSQGTVKFFNETKGFGFIKEIDSDAEHFVHVSGLIDRISEGEKVEFELIDGKKGLKAVNQTDHLKALIADANLLANG